MSSDEENNSPYDEEDNEEIDEEENEENDEDEEEEEQNGEEEGDDDDERLEDEGNEDENSDNVLEEEDEFGQVGGQLDREEESIEETPEQSIVIDRQEYDHNANADSGQPSLPSFDNLVKGAMDGFGSGTIGDIVGQISSMSGGEGGLGLSNALASGTLSALAGQLIASAAHQFLGINPDTGRIIGAIAGNLIFGLGGRDNSLSGIGKLILDQLVSGRFQRPVQPFVSPRPDFPSFQLNFQAERERCLREKRLFEDPEFGANDQSLYFSRSPSKLIEWKRPGEIMHEPQLLVEQNASRFDVVQGQLGDCWLLAAAAALTLREELFFRVVPPDQSFVENYAGIFHFQFWRYGQWVDVVIDDRLPTHNGKLLYMHSPNGNSFWSALLEKAYAKLYGSYEALKGGTTSEALEDFTGGLIEHFDLEEMSEEQILAVLVRGFQMGSFFGCSIDADPNVTEARLDNGLVMGHAYSITAIQTIQDGPNGPIVLLRIRNPWGEHEWTGPWSDGAPEWNYVSEVDRQRMHLSFADDGEFWMCLADFHREFQRMECCNLGPEVLDEICEMMDLKDERNIKMMGGIQQQQRQWSQFSANGEWSIARGTAGGCKNYPTFDKNPQYGTMVVSIGNSPEADGKCTLICAVLQKYRRELRAHGLDDLPIGFAVYPLKKGEENSAQRQQQQIQPNYYAVKNLGYGPGYGQSNLPYGPGYGPGYPPISPTPSMPTKMQRLDQTMLHGVKTVAKSASFVNLREVTARFRLHPGQYVIIPSTYEPDQEAQFLLRVFCSGQFQTIEL